MEPTLFRLADKLLLFPDYITCAACKYSYNLWFWLDIILLGTVKIKSKIGLGNLLNIVDEYGHQYILSFMIQYKNRRNEQTKLILNRDKIR